jgi:hypothetical protein
MGLFTKVDFSRQVQQHKNTYAHLSGSTHIDQGLIVRGGITGSSDNNVLIVTASTGNTVILCLARPLMTGINYNTPANGGSPLQIDRNFLPVGTGVDIELTNTGQVAKILSSKRFKRDIKPLSYEDYKHLLNLNPVQFKWRGTNQDSVGFIAEQAHELGLSKFMVYDEEGKPEAISYKLLTVAIIGLLKNGIEIPKVTSTIKEPIEDIPIIITEDYTTTTTRYIIAKKDDITITLDDTNLKRYYIKSMSEISVVPTQGLIDEEWQEIKMGPQSSIELIAYEGNWYVLSSDGLKNS